MLTNDEIAKMREGYKSPMYKRLLIARRDLRDAIDEVDTQTVKFSQLLLFDPDDVSSAA